MKVRPAFPAAVLVVLGAAVSVVLFGAAEGWAANDPGPRPAQVFRSAHPGSARFPAPSGDLAVAVPAASVARHYRRTQDGAGVEVAVWVAPGQHGVVAHLGTGRGPCRTQPVGPGVTWVRCNVRQQRRSPVLTVRLTGPGVHLEQVAGPES